MSCKAVFDTNGMFHSDGAQRIEGDYSMKDVLILASDKLKARIVVDYDKRTVSLKPKKRKKK